MVWSYAAGTTTAGYGGMAELPSVRFNDGTFKSLFVPPLVQTAPLRVPSGPVPRGGGTVGDALLDVWAFDLQGWFDAIVGDDVQAVTDYLRLHVNAAQGDMTLTLKGRGWSSTQTMTVRLNGQVTVDEPEVERKKGETRIVTIPLIAADPRRYGTAITTAITTATNVTNAGTTPAPFEAVFVGPLTDAELNGPGTGNIITLSTVASGQTITVTTVDPATGTTTLADNISTDPMDLFGLMVTDTADYIQPGTEAWTFTKSAGAGTCSIRVSPAYG